MEAFRDTMNGSLLKRNLLLVDLDTTVHHYSKS
jgi:hypothetical protein